MGRVVKPLAIAEILFLVVAFAAGVTVIIPVLEAENQLPKVKCMPYASVEYNYNPPYFWGNVDITPPESNGTCDYCLFVQITVVVAALASALYRLVTVVAEKADLSFLRTLSVPLYALCTLSVLIEAIILQIGVNRFLGMVMVYKTSSSWPEKTKTCELVQSGLQKLADKSSLDINLNFCSELPVATVASWVSAVTWIILTVLTGVQFHMQRKPRQNTDRQMLVYGTKEERSYEKN